LGKKNHIAIGIGAMHLKDKPQRGEIFIVVKLSLALLRCSAPKYYFMRWLSYFFYQQLLSLRVFGVGFCF